MFLPVATYMYIKPNTENVYLQNLLLAKNPKPKSMIEKALYYMYKKYFYFYCLYIFLKVTLVVN